MERRGRPAPRDIPGGPGPGIAKVEICGDPTKVFDWLGEPVAKADFEIDWVDEGEPGLLAVDFSTEHGIVRID